MTVLEKIGQSADGSVALTDTSAAWVAVGTHCKHLTTLRYLNKNIYCNETLGVITHVEVMAFMS